MEKEAGHGRKAAAGIKKKEIPGKKQLKLLEINNEKNGKMVQSSCQQF